MLSPAPAPAPAPGPAAADFDLPPHVLQLVLSRLSLRDRLLAAALVCSAWSAAAAAATDRVTLDMSAATAAQRHDRAASLALFLARCGTTQLSALAVCGAHMSRPRVELATASLRRLQQVSYSSVRLELSSGDEQQQPEHPGRQRHAAALTSLQLHDCLVTTSRQQPASATTQWSLFASLQTLDLQQLSCSAALEAQLKGERALASVVQHLGRLTQLTLKSLVNIPEGPLLASLGGCLGGMQQLRELRLALPGLTAATLAAAPPSLTLLEAEGAQALEFTSSHGLGALAGGLQHLSIEGARAFEPALLSSMRRLRHLRLRLTSSRFKPDGFAGTQHLLAALWQLCSQLEVLDLRNVLQHLLEPPQQPHQQQHQHDPEPAYAALTSSTALRRLNLTGCRFPAACFPLLFNEAGVHLPHLTALQLYGLYDAVGGRLEPLDVRVIAACCPVLRELSLWVARSDDSRAVAEGIRLHSVTALTSLTSLTLGGQGVRNAAAVSTLARLTQLCSLALFGARHFSRPGLQQLQALRGLTYLLAEACGLPPALTNEPDRLELELCTLPRGGAKPTRPSHQPVWRQLQRLLADSPVDTATPAAAAPDLLQLIFEGDGDSWEEALEHMFGGGGGASDD